MRFGKPTVEPIEDAEPKTVEVVTWNVEAEDRRLQWGWAFGDDLEAARAWLAVLTGDPDENGWVRDSDFAIKSNELRRVSLRRITKSVPVRAADPTPTERAEQSQHA